MTAGAPASAVRSPAPKPPKKGRIAALAARARAPTTASSRSPSGVPRRSRRRAAVSRPSSRWPTSSC
ncbi:hypothetical protein ACU686_19545 [Yinghuangia aomiensis]